MTVSGGSSFVSAASVVVVRSSSGISRMNSEGVVARCLAPCPVTLGVLRYSSERARVMPT